MRSILYLNHITYTGCGKITSQGVYNLSQRHLRKIVDNCSILGLKNLTELTNEKAIILMSFLLKYHFTYHFNTIFY